VESRDPAGSTTKPWCTTGVASVIALQSPEASSSLPNFLWEVQLLLSAMTLFLKHSVQRGRKLLMKSF